MEIYFPLLFVFCFIHINVIFRANMYQISFVICIYHLQKLNICISTWGCFHKYRAFFLQKQICLSVSSLHYNERVVVVPAHTKLLLSFLLCEFCNRVFSNFTILFPYHSIKYFIPILYCLQFLLFVFTVLKKPERHTLLYRNFNFK